MCMSSCAVVHVERDFRAGKAHPNSTTACCEGKVPRSVCSESCPVGKRKVPRRGEPTCCFDCIMCPEGEISNKTDSNDCTKCPPAEWSSEQRENCMPKIVEFISYEDPMGTGLATSSVLLSAITLSVFCVFIVYRHTPVVKANNLVISYGLLVALILCFLSSLLFIGQPRKVTCMLRQIAFGISFSLCISCILAKTTTVVIAFSATKPNSKLSVFVGSRLPHYIIILSVIVQLILCISWLTTSPPFPVLNMNVAINIISVECNEGSAFTFYCMLGYLGLLAAVSFIAAFLARKLPDSFNEAKFITFSMVVFLSVWLSFVPAYVSTKGKYMVAVEIFAIMSSSGGLLCCIFFPKCYVILLHPEWNTKEYLIRMGNSNKRLNRNS
ncbi:vomeronasal type-2 receptor 26-like [Protopterus annectens]|uniref:vomeronasal type-2 receptor 26-like n=1 Tax=Protopterus annectens TaxID=7888 RepID=UPI001CFB298C|nr:vomeronasal type-2 receptor 26-like [Protopterus annectens]